ncbi:MAG: Uma2 family endonuclease [Lachnospiraceae bacterium]|nr:Uma2 family endonuclease [Lachnospiraceae bacterium]MCI9400531.1 Uma2 family endonuclease [Lachnospiraceae bacterium]MCX4375311.1 Uma2 family endonuclease [Lachnospiraceae bacterium]
MALLKEKLYTTDDIYALPDGKRAELFDGQLYDMAPPNFLHQKLVLQLSVKIANYIDAKGGECEVMPAPFAVFLNKDNRTYVEPDVSIICDKSKLDDYGCNGAPDWVIEITSPSDPSRDYGIKLFKYRSAGVREYWIVNPQKHTITVFDFEKDQNSNQYNWEDDIPVCIYSDLTINIAKLLNR